MRLTKAKLREMNIINAHDLAKAAGGLMLVVSYSPAENGRMARYAHWSVWRVGKAVDPSGHWQDHGSKTFTVRGREHKEPVRLEALRWASQKFGVQEWDKSPLGSYHPKGTLAKAVAAKQTDN